MRHGKKGKKFHRIRGERAAFLRNLSLNLIRRGRMETTEARAKAVRPLVERAVTIARQGTLAARRLLIRRLHNRQAVERLLREVGPRYANRPGGYLRIVKSAKARKRDGSRLAIIEFVE
ncbi:MAG: 50S ribosomal protein L17 [Candidatus Liptonbacteria bacterium]|nr:50S ribosomal protein L17 [Candidatus Liptonbacteria bacterium]